MKILFINSVCGFGSTGRICTDLAQLLEKEGYECKIAYGRNNVLPAHQKYAVKIGNKIGTIMHAGLSRVFDRAGFYSKHATKKFIKWIKEYNPDIIHLHSLVGYYINIKILFDYLRKCNKKIIWTLHDCWNFTGHCSHFDYVNCYKWKEQCYSCPQKKEYPKSMIFSQAKKNYIEKKNAIIGINNMTIVTVSKWLANMAKESFLKEYPIKTIYNGIDLDVFKETENNFKKEHKIVGKYMILGVASVWSPRKGLDDFLRLAEILDNEKYQIVLVGLNKKQLKTLPKNIIGLSRTSSTKELAQLYTAADIFVNTSVEETMGLTTVEAIACRTPVIVYNKTALPEVVNSTVGKVVVNFEELKNTLVEMLDAPKKLNDITTYIHEFDKKEMLRKYLELYKEVNS